MSRNLRNFVKGASMLRSVANQVPAEAWNSTSCCDGWTAKQVAGHISRGLESVANIAQGGGFAAQLDENERAGDDRPPPWLQPLML
jgi:hypothetical protein